MLLLGLGQLDEWHWGPTSTVQPFSSLADGANEGGGPSLVTVRGKRWTGASRCQAWTLGGHGEAGDEDPACRERWEGQDLRPGQGWGLRQGALPG